MVAVYRFEAGRRPASNHLRTSFESASVMEFGFNRPKLILHTNLQRIALAGNLGEKNRLDITTYSKAFTADIVQELITR